MSVLEAILTLQQSDPQQNKIVPVLQRCLYTFYFLFFREVCFEKAPDWPRGRYRHFCSDDGQIILHQVSHEVEIMLLEFM
jgi:hypothetical protein